MQNRADVTGIPFNHFLGIKEDGAALVLPEGEQYRNHLGTVHASAQFALAEAASGQWLLGRFGDEASKYMAVVRKVEAKFRRPANGALHAQAEAGEAEAAAFADSLARRGRGMLAIRVRVLDKDDQTSLEADFEWFAQKFVEA
jgi:acyl-coenzyme A thioesterase PaaI-like protein